MNCIDAVEILIVQNRLENVNIRQKLAISIMQAAGRL